MKQNMVNVIAIRILGFLTCGWIYAAYSQLRWLLHIHWLHSLIPNSTFSFNYPLYLGFSLGYLATGVAAAGLLVFLPASTLGFLTPATTHSSSLSAFWISAGMILGIVLFILGIHSALSTAMWTVYRSAKEPGWAAELLASSVISCAGVCLSRAMLARQTAA